MRIVFLTAALLLSAPAFAQQSVDEQVYAATATISHAALNLGQRVIDDEAQIAVLTKQIAALAKERDDLKAAKADAAKPAAP